MTEYFEMISGLVENSEALRLKEAFVSDVHSERGDRRRDSADILQGIKARPPTGVGEDFLFNSAADKSGTEHFSQILPQFQLPLLHMKSRSA
jgi:hypothetical protein